ncbi:MAG: B12-binding domain-containing protein [Planctomycetota bacterium]
MSAAPEFTAFLLRLSARAYAQASLSTLESSRPRLVQTALPATFAQPEDDLEVRIQQIACSLLVGAPELLADALRWYRVAFHHRDVPPEYLPATMQAIEKTFERELPRESLAAVRQHLAVAMEALEDAPVDMPSFLDRTAPHGDAAMHFLLANLEGRGDDALDIVRKSLAEGVSIADVQDHVLSPAQREAGRMWLMTEIPIADEHYGSNIVERAIWLLQEHVARPPKGAARVLTMGVAGNLHDLGLRMVAQRLQLAGYDVHHLGANMPAGDLEWSLSNREVDVIALSANLLLHLHDLREAVQTVRKAMASVYGEQHARPILVGGRPFEIVPDLAARVGADAGVADVREAPSVVSSLLSK